MTAKSSPETWTQHAPSAPGSHHPNRVKTKLVTPSVLSDPAVKVGRQIVLSRATRFQGHGVSLRRSTWKMATESYLLRDAVGVWPDETVQRWVMGGLCARQCEDGDGQRRAGHQALARVRLGWLRGPLDACESTLGTGSRSRDGLVDLIAATPSP